VNSLHGMVKRYVSFESILADEWNVNTFIVYLDLPWLPHLSAGISRPNKCWIISWTLHGTIRVPFT
jgi:hypothetical protein